LDEEAMKIKFPTDNDEPQADEIDAVELFTDDTAIIRMSSGTTIELTKEDIDALKRWNLFA
jgi:hypothetical protein